MTKSDLDFNLSSYNYDLPPEQVAQKPLEIRHNSKLLVYNQKTDKIIHTNFHQIHQYLPENSTLVLNKSKVFPCRLLGNKTSGGKAEIFLLTSSPDQNNLYESLIRTTGKKHIGDEYIFKDLKAKIERINENGTFDLSFNKDPDLEKIGHIPIPPYIRDGISNNNDVIDYQTIYAKDKGSVAAPTAGFHFTEEVFSNLDKKNIQKAFVTLHVGLGTFKTVKEEDIRNHKMHSEKYFIGKDSLKKIKEGNIFAVGTTSLRVLESMDDNTDADKVYETDIFLHPGKNISSIKGMITNFHLPKSSLLMLVSTLLGREKTLEIYKEAALKDYRFYSYGDAMLVLL